MRHDVAYVAKEIGKTENWLRRNAPRLPHSRAGRTYFWDDADLAALREALRVRPARSVGADPMRPVPARRRAS